MNVLVCIMGAIFRIIIIDRYGLCLSNQKSSNQKVLFKVGTFYNNQHKLSRAFQTDMHNKLHKLNTEQ
jgi:hypothetical protein